MQDKQRPWERDPLYITFSIRSTDRNTACWDLPIFLGRFRCDTPKNQGHSFKTRRAAASFDTWLLTVHKSDFFFTLYQKPWNMPVMVIKSRETQYSMTGGRGILGRSFAKRHVAWCERWWITHRLQTTHVVSIHVLIYFMKCKAMIIIIYIFLFTITKFEFVSSCDEDVRSSPCSIRSKSKPGSSLRSSVWVWLLARDPILDSSKDRDEHRAVSV